ncbi:asparagine synthetase B [Bodo saltans virus]|uniref:asparagine synthase (glutamine-hydrolyzing) n=1 Tax=Bodo saltans virus TaxID=2024608 RepID=A0A2H4UU81_9VIRU|nr:asparagine synthetase B [Bodo saltans virus]ATZ80491.1 asparagine synthetase B [Bodo saltans virus]
MCGIWAIIRKNTIVTSFDLNALNKVKRRGPDSTTIHSDKNYAVAFHRLAINDLSVNGNQPFYYSNETHNYILMTNGEIYTHKLLEKKYDIFPHSRSDCAVLLPLFIEHKENFIELCKDLKSCEYAMLIIKQSKFTNEIEFFLSTDTSSVRPAFYYIDMDKKEIGFSSILPGLSDYSSQVIRFDQKSCLIGKVNYDTNELTYNVYKYHQSPTKHLIIKTEKDLYNLMERIANTFMKAVKIRLESDRPISAAVSGGLDSCAVSAMAAKLLKEDGKLLHTATVSLKGGTDVPYAESHATNINSIHTTYYVTIEEALSHLDEVIYATGTWDITTIRASVWQFLLAKKIREHTDCKVVLIGDGADECMMGYLSFYSAPNVKDAEKFRNQLLDEIHYFDGLRPDRCLAYHGLEARVPELDTEFVDLYREIPPELLIPTKDRIEKFLFRETIRTFFPGLLLPEHEQRKKEAFSDGVSSTEKSWFQICKDYYSEKISDEEFETRHSMTGVIPLCKESFYYRKKFNEFFGENHSTIPHYWLHPWSGNSDPSARLLKVYNE